MTSLPFTPSTSGTASPDLIRGRDAVFSPPFPGAHTVESSQIFAETGSPHGLLSHRCGWSSSKSLATDHSMEEESQKRKWITVTLQGVRLDTTTSCCTSVVSKVHKHHESFSNMHRGAARPKIRDSAENYWIQYTTPSKSAFGRLSARAASACYAP